MDYCGWDLFKKSLLNLNISEYNFFILDNGCFIVFRLCENRIYVFEKWDSKGLLVFIRNKDYNKVGFFIEDK